MSHFSAVFQCSPLALAGFPGECWSLPSADGAHDGGETRLSQEWDLTLLPCLSCLQQEMRTRMNPARRSCRPALTMSCTSWRSSGRFCLPACPPQSTAVAGPASLSPSSSSVCSRPSLGTWPPTLAAPSASRTRSQLLFSWHLAPLCQVRVQDAWVCKEDITGLKWPFASLSSLSAQIWA